MQKQDFEKQVQQKMEELSFMPSVPVWQNIEHQIRKKKDRKRVLFFWLFPLLLAGGSLFLWNNYFNFPKTYSVFQRDPNLTIEQAEHKPANNKDATTPLLPINDINTTTPILTPSHKEASNSIENKAIKKRSYYKPTETLYFVTKKQITPSTVNKSIESKKQRTNIKPYTQPALPKLLRKDYKALTATNLEDTLPLAQASVSPNLSIAPIDSLSRLAPQKIETKQTPTDSTQLKKQEPKIPKWSLAVQGTYGISTVQTQLLDRAAWGTPILNPSSTSVTSTPSRLENSYAFSAGALTKRTLTKRLALAIGMNYSFFSTKSYTGNQVNRDTVLQTNSVNVNGTRLALSEYYRRGETRQYKNQYHFLELPVGIEWQVYKKLPFYFQTGFSLSYLISTNALVYAPDAGIYYQNKDLFTKTQLHINSGFTYRIWQLNGKKIHIGPYMQYGITDLQREKQKENYHLFAAGLKAQFSF